MRKSVAPKKPKADTKEKPGCIAENGTCGRPVQAKGLCSGHYRRQWLAEKEGTQADLSTPIDDGSIPWVTLVTLKVPVHVADHLKKVADANGETLYSQLQKIVYAWYEKSTGEKATP